MARKKKDKPSINNSMQGSGHVGPGYVDDAPNILKSEQKQNAPKIDPTVQGNPNASFTQTPPPNYGVQGNQQTPPPPGYGQAPPPPGYGQAPPPPGYGQAPPPPGYGQAAAAGMPYYNYNQKKSGGWWKGLIIFAIIVAVLVFLGYSVNSFFSNLFSFDTAYEESYELPDDEYIARIAVEGEITSVTDDGYLTSETTYNHEFTLDAIDDLIKDKNNKALLLFVDTPGGGVYESDQLYLKIKEYQEKTSNPVYVAMGSMAASGGYYISAPADKILADRNCWTGSIGVVLGTHYDVSGFLDKHGIKAENLTAGKNKAMGSIVEPLTDEQRNIYQGLLDDAYNQFVGLIAEGRDMKIEDVRRLADGRIYTAKQAESNGLIDGIASEEEVTEMLKTDHNLKDCEVVPVESYNESSWMDDFLYEGVMPIVDNLKALGKSDLSTVLNLADENEKLPLKYIYLN